MEKREFRELCIGCAPSLITMFQFRRKSVEGLSMYLFVFAFLGNLFYVLSILTSPLMSEDFLLESFPYEFHLSPIASMADFQALDIS